MWVAPDILLFAFLFSKTDAGWQFGFQQNRNNFVDYTPFIFIAAAPVIVSGSVYFMVRKMSEPENMLRPIAGGLNAEQQQTLRRYERWLIDNQFEYKAGFQFGTIKVVAFQQENAQRIFSVYFHKKTSIDIESWFDDANNLTTATSGSIGMFPQRPGAYKQSYPGLTAADAWQRHLAGEAHLMQKFGLTWQPLTQPYQEALLNSIRLQMQFVRAIPLYPIRALYWYAVMRKKMANRSVQQQYP
jgi:hypothetical protein